jgi:hypothetical protein
MEGNSMATSKTQEKPGVKLPLIILAGVLVLIFIVFLAKTFLSPAHNENANTKQMNEQTKAFAAAAKEAGPDADLSKLSPATREAFEKQVGPAPMDHSLILKNWMKSHAGQY